MLAGACLAFAAAAGAALGWRDVFIARAANAPGALVFDRMTHTVDGWVGRRAARTMAGTPGVVFGDSVMAMRDKGPGFGSAFKQGMINQWVPSDPADVFDAGLGPLQYYYLFDRVLAGHPRFAVVEVNLRTFAPDWQDERGLQIPQLSAGLGVRRTARIADALAAQQMSVLDPFVYRLEDRLGLLFAADGARAVFNARLDATGAWINARLGVEEATPASRFARFAPFRLDADTARRWFERDFVAGAPTPALHALLAAMRDAGIVVQLVVAPVNVQRLAELGVAPDLAVRTAALRDAIGATRQEWLDPSSQFKSTDFVDAVHVNGVAQVRLAMLITGSLAPRVAEVLGLPRQIAPGPSVAAHAGITPAGAATP